MKHDKVIKLLRSRLMGCEAIIDTADTHDRSPECVAEARSYRAAIACLEKDGEPEPPRKKTCELGEVYGGGYGDGYIQFTDDIDSVRNIYALHHRAIELPRCYLRTDTLRDLIAVLTRYADTGSFAVEERKDGAE